jgi:hypothetical protein
MPLNETELLGRIDKVDEKIGTLATEVASISECIKGWDKWQQQLVASVTQWQDKISERVRAVEIDATEIRHVKELHEVLISALSRQNELFGSKIWAVVMIVLTSVITAILTKILGG